jgi:hypothetical protein
MEARMDNGIETVRSMTKRRVAVLLMMETSTSTGDIGQRQRTTASRPSGP